MLDTITTVLVALLGVHILVKFAFFGLPYRRRRAALDKAYGDKPAASVTADRVVLAFAVALGGLLVWRGVDAVSFLGGLWIGATVIQQYFHEFRAAVEPERAAPEPVSPIKVMSYAIQDSPWRPWRELAILAVLVVAALTLMLVR